MMIDFGSKGKYVMDRAVDESLMKLGKEVWFTFWWLTRNVVWKPEGLEHKEYGILIPRGSWVISLSQLADEVDVTIKVMRRILKQLEKLELIIVEQVEVRTKGGKKKMNKITIQNYDSYQTFDRDAYQESMRARAEEQARAQGGTQENPEKSRVSDDGGHEEDAKRARAWAQARARGRARANPDISRDSSDGGHEVGHEQGHEVGHKKNESIKNEGITNEGINNQPSNEDSLSLEEWKTDQDYLYCKEQCGWLVGSDSKIHQYFVSARKEMSSNEEMIDAWNAYTKKEPLKDQNLATFLSYKYKEFLHTESSSPIIPFGKYAHLAKRSRIPRR